MPSRTPNYSLIKPAENEFYDVGIFNQNADIIDAQIKQESVGLQDEMATHANAADAHSAVAAPTAGAIMRRDAAGRAQVEAPSVAADIARLDTVTAHALQVSAATTSSIAALRRKLRMGAM